MKYSDKYNLKDNINKLSKLVSVIDDFFINKNFNNKNFLKNLKNDIYNICQIEFNNKQLYNILIFFNSNHNNYNKFKKFNNFLNNELNNNYFQEGGFIYNETDNKYEQVMNIIDFMFDLINLVPNNIITNNYVHVAAPYGVVGLCLNLIRKKYDFAFYSFIGLIPGIGGFLSGSLKLTHKFIKFNLNKVKVKDQNIDKKEEYYKRLRTTKIINTYLKDNYFEKNNNPFLSDFEDNYDYHNHHNDINFI